MKEHKTHCDRVVEYLNQFGSITSRDAFVDLGITRLSAVVFDLKHKGYNIDTKFESSKNRWGDTTCYARYSFRKAE